MWSDLNRYTYIEMKSQSLRSVIPSKSEPFVLSQLTLSEPSMELGEILVALDFRGVSESSLCSNVRKGSRPETISIDGLKEAAAVLMSIHGV